MNVLSDTVQSSTVIKPSIPTPKVVPIKDIPFDKLIIPSYQRPYKWKIKNVNQLINDILTFRNKAHYRLGTLVLFNDEIVDGQQRIITLTLLIKNILGRINYKDNSVYKKTFDMLESFSNQTKFSNRYSLYNAVENLRAIETREADLTEEILNFILNKCEFVVIKLSDISEAFQFFDSQNARGKDLEPHDLLKAYHLREMPKMSENDSININYWQKQNTSYLRDVFLTLYRAKRWSQGKSARFFTKNRTDIFKGISLSETKRYPFYQLEVIAHIFSDYYNQDPIRVIDHNHLEYPFNLDDQIVNGSRFFDMIRHYIELYNNLRKSRYKLPSGSIAEKIIQSLDNYDGSERTGDKYVKSMFLTLLLYYVDRFGYEELDKVIPKFFIWAYSLRLKSKAVQLPSVDNYASERSSMLRRVHDAQTPYDIINIPQECINKVECGKCEKIKNLFRDLKKYNG